MVDRIGGGRNRRSVAAVLLAATLVLPSFVSAQELIERTLAIVDGQVITLSDARLALDLRLVAVEADAADPLAAATERLIERALMLREVEHFAPPDPSPESLEQLFAVTRARVPSAAAFETALARGGFSEDQLRVWLRDDLRLAAYLDQRFAAAGVPTDQDAMAYYDEHRGEFERGGVPLEEALPLIRERLAGERRRELIADWLSDLRRRAEITQLGDAGR